MEKNLGHATAYGYAKSKGYSGTEEEFAELMADYASVGQSAAQSAEQAAASATSASASAQTASQAAQTATSKASEAVTAAGTATTKASEASQSASTASAAATSASTSAQTATAKAGTATAKADEAAASEAAALSAKTDAETARDAAAQSASQAAASAESIDPDEFDRKIYAAFATDTASGPIAHFEDGADSIPMKDVLIHIEPVQEGSGDPSPDNVRPITGWTGMKVTRTGKNLLEMFGKNGNSLLSKNTFVKAGTYIVSTSGINGNYATRVRKATTEGSITGDIIASKENQGNVTFTLEKDTNLMVQWYAPNDSSADLTGKTFQLELGSTATDYEPYHADTYDITFPTEAGTVYGGTLDVTNGELVVDRAMADLETLDWTYVQNYKYFSSSTLSSAIARPVSAQTPIAGLLCSIYKIASAQDAGSGNVDKTISVDTYGYLRIKDLAYTDVNTWKEAVGSQTTAYPLATPITYHLTPQEITSLLGTNNLWADTGDSDVEYRADTKLYVDNKIAELQALVLENNGGN